MNYQGRPNRTRQPSVVVSRQAADANEEGGPIAQWESASFARRMPWVRIPVGPYVGLKRTESLKWVSGICLNPTEPMHHPVQAWVGRVETCLPTLRRVDDTVCTCDPGVHWTRSAGSWILIRRPWLLCQLVDSSARVPMKDVPSCDKLRGAARRLRT